MFALIFLSQSRLHSFDSFVSHRITRIEQRRALARCEQENKSDKKFFISAFSGGNVKDTITKQNNYLKSDYIFIFATAVELTS